MNSIKVTLALAALGLAWTHPASAGRTDFSPVLILINGTAGAAAGSFGSTRNDILDPNEYIRCYSLFNPDGTVTPGGWLSGACSARKNGVTVSCNFPGLSQFQYQRALATATSDSFISFTWNTQTKDCTSLYVYGDSFDEPKLP